MPLNPRHPMVLDQLRQVYLAREDWAASSIRPCPAQGGQADRPAEEETLLHQAWCGRLEAASGSPDTCARSGGTALQTAPGSRVAGQLRGSPAPIGADAGSCRSLAGGPAQGSLPELFARLPKLKLTTTSPC